MSISNYLEDKIINHFFKGTNQANEGGAANENYLGLYTADPTEAGSHANEVTGGGYARAQITSTGWGTPAGSGVKNTAVLSFTNMPAGTVTHAAISDAATAGNMLISGALTTAQVFAGAENFSFAIGEVDLTFD